MRWLLQASQANAWRDYFYALAVMALWAFAFGAFFATVHNAFSHVHLRRPVQHA